MSDQQRQCVRPGCGHTTDHISGYHSDACLQAEMAPDDLPPVTVLAPNKSGGFGRGMAWSQRTPVHLPAHERPGAAR